MNRKNVLSGSKFEELIGFSRAVRIGNIIAISGTAPINKDGKTEGIDNLYIQTTRCLTIIKKAIEDAGGNINNTIRTRVFLTNISDWENAARAHGDFFKDIKPASTFVECSGLINEEWLVEIEADCVVD